MFYFIPSWYSGSNRRFGSKKELYGLDLAYKEFDDTINQVRMFKDHGDDAELVILNYYPQLRYFLHRQDILETSYVSIFDIIQNINTKDMKIITLQDLEYPSDVEIMYSPFVVFMMKNDKVVSTVYLGLEGNILRIESSLDERNKKEFLMDDRGFLSSIVYKNSEDIEEYQEYLNEKGEWQIREYYTKNLVEINPRERKRFKREYYDSIEQIIEEKLQEYSSKKVIEEDIVVVTANKNHNNIIWNTKIKGKIILSFFGERYNLDNINELRNDLSKANLVVVDTDYNEEKIKKEFDSNYVYHISPYDTRLRLGMSQRKKELIIYYLVDEMTESHIYNIKNIFDIMVENKNIEIVLDTELRNKSELEKIIGLLFGNDEKYEEIDSKRIEIVNTKTEIEIIRIFETVRLIVDLSEKPNIFVQIAGISAGIPQINKIKTSYVQDKKNGLIINDNTELKDAINFYFKGLRNWNESLVYSVNKITEYTSGKIVEKWKEYILRG